MKTTYLVKRNPKQPTGNDNWIIMDGEQFKAFRESEEGRKRSNNFIKLCTEYDEVCIVMECDLEKLKEWKSELNHSIYMQNMKKERGYQVISYHAFDAEGEDVNGEDVLKDEADSVEECVIRKIEAEKLVQLVEQLDAENQDLIYSFYLTTTPMMETVYGKIHGMSNQLVHFRKARALKRLKKLYFS